MYFLLVLDKIFILYLRVTLNSGQSSCLSLLSATIFTFQFSNFMALLGVERPGKRGRGRERMKGGMLR